MSESQIQVRLNPDVQTSGSDLAIVNAARRSFNTRSEWEYLDPWTETPGVIKDKDKRLIQFLARGMTADDFETFLVSTTMNLYPLDDQDEFMRKQLCEDLWDWRNTATHDTPFNHCFVSFEVKAPIFVARQLVKTEYAPFSEFSRRYITEDVEFYQHDYREASKDKKQGSGGIHNGNEHWQKIARMKNLEALDQYNRMIDDGVAPEQARGCLPTDLMTAWTWSMTLGAAAKMCRERCKSDAQVETRYVADQVYEYLKEYYPVSAKALVEGPDV